MLNRQTPKLCEDPKAWAVDSREASVPSINIFKSLDDSMVADAAGIDSPSSPEQEFDRFE